MHMTADATDQLRGANVFITGGAGFIGSTLASRLVDDNRITIYDNFARDSLSSTSLASHPNVHIVRGDILDLEASRCVDHWNQQLVSGGVAAGSIDDGQRAGRLARLCADDPALRSPLRRRGLA